MWSDTLLAAERSHLIRVVIWAVTSAVLGTTFVTIIAGRRMSAPIALWFAIQTVVWGSVELIIAAARWSALSMRDVSGATRLDRLIWFTIGIDVGIIAAGVTAVMPAAAASIGSTTRPTLDQRDSTLQNPCINDLQ